MLCLLNLCGWQNLAGCRACIPVWGPLLALPEAGRYSPRGGRVFGRNFVAKIHRVTLHLVRLELIDPYLTSVGEFRERCPVVLKVETDIATTYAEAPCMEGPYYNEETLKTVVNVLSEFLIPAVLGKDIATPQALHENYLARFRGNHIAKSGLDTALYHLLSEPAGLSLQNFIGGEWMVIQSGIGIGIQPTIDDLVAAVGSALEQDYSRIKIQPGWELEPVRALRQQFGDFPLMVDANGAYTLRDLALIQALDDYDLTMIEQPLSFDDLVDHAKLQAQIDTAICLDESVASVAHARAAVALQACRIVNIKLSRLGGIYPAIQVHDICRAAGLDVWCGGMIESAIGQADCLALASLPGFRHAADIAPSERYFKRDLITPFVPLCNGTMAVPTGMGLGFEIDLEALDACTDSRPVCE